MSGIGHNRGPGLAGSSWRSHCWRRAQSLPGDAVLMIGETAHEREMMTVGGLAGFVSGQAFFAGVTDAL